MKRHITKLIRTHSENNTYYYTTDLPDVMYVEKHYGSIDYLQDLLDHRFPHIDCIYVAIHSHELNGRLYGEEQYYLVTRTSMTKLSSLRCIFGKVVDNTHIETYRYGSFAVQFGYEDEGIVF